MEYFLFSLGIVAISVGMYFYATQKQRSLTTETDTNEKEDGSDNNTNEPQTSPTSKTDYTGMKSRELSKALLADLNCKIMENEEDNDRIDFVFQSETFCLVASDDCLLVTVYDFAWGSVELNDIDEVSRLRKAINSVNFKFGGLCIIYSMDTEKNRMVVHTKRQFLLTPEIPNILDYMTAMLSGFFEVQRSLSHELDQLRLEKEGREKKDTNI